MLLFSKCNAKLSHLSIFRNLILDVKYCNMHWKEFNTILFYYKLVVKHTNTEQSHLQIGLLI